MMTQEKPEQHPLPNITELLLKPALTFYPNPNDGKFTMEVMLDKKEKAKIEIIDTNGKKVFEDTFKGSGLHKKQIDLQSNGTGVYIVTLTQNGTTLSREDSS